jgi:hypothetical protein
VELGSEVWGYVFGLELCASIHAVYEYICSLQPQHEKMIDKFEFFSRKGIQSLHFCNGNDSHVIVIQRLSW